MIRKRLIAMAVAVAFSTSSSASINSEMQSFFNELGAYGNVTGPQALKGQTGTTFVGGNLYMRAPQRTYNLFHFSPPGIKAGCGGIDLFAGSFSFMNAEQLTALLQNLANNAIGVAFELAIETISPQLAAALKWAQDQASKLNNLNLNSCQLATGIVTAAWPNQDIAQKVAARRGLDPQYNFSADSLKSWWNQLTNPPSQTRNETNAIIASDPRTKETIGNVNVVWNALNRIGVSDSELRELMMSLTGTIIITRNKSDDSKPDFRHVPPPQKITFKTLVGDPASSVTSIRIMKCPDYECLNPGEGVTSAMSFAKYSRDRISSIVTKISNRMANTLTADEYRFLQGTFVPIWKIASMPDSAYAEGLTDVMSQIIAMDLAFSYFNEITKELHKALANSKSTDSPTNKDQLEKFYRHLSEVRQEARDEMAAEAQRLSALLGMQQNIARIDYEIKRGLSEPIRLSMETFSKR